MSRLGRSLLGARGIGVPRKVFEGRSLGIEGRLTPEAFGSVRSGLLLEIGPRDIPLFEGPAGVDLQVGREIDALLPAAAEAGAAFERAILVGVTQQHGKSWDLAPRGAQTVCLLRFPGGIPPLLGLLPELDDWSDSVALWVGTRWDVERLEERSGAR